MPKRSIVALCLPPLVLLCACSPRNFLSRRLAADQQGATAIEHALVATGVGAAVAATVYHLGSTTAGLYSQLSSLF